MGWTPFRVSAQVWEVERQESHLEKCNSFVYCYYGSITEDITNKLHRLHWIRWFKPTNTLKFKGLLKTIYQETFTSITEDASGVGKKHPILFTIVKTTHDKITLKDHFLNRNILPLKNWVTLSWEITSYSFAPIAAFSWRTRQFLSLSYSWIIPQLLNAGWQWHFRWDAPHNQKLTTSINIAKTTETETLEQNSP